MSIAARSTVISNGTSLSAAVLVGDHTLVSIQMPSTWTSASLTFQASVDGITYQNVYSSTGTELTLTAAASTYIYLDPAIFSGAIKIKVRSGTSGAAVNQGGDRTLWLAMKQV